MHSTKVKKVILILALILLLPASAYAVCSPDPNNRVITGILTIEAGKSVVWRLRAIDPDYGIQGGYVDIVPQSFPNWVVFGPRIAPDPNRYIFAPKNLKCDGNEVDPNIALIVSRQLTISPPVTISGLFNIDYQVTDGNGVNYCRIRATVVKPGNEPPNSDSGLNELLGVGFYRIMNRYAFLWLDERSWPSS